MTRFTSKAKVLYSSFILYYTNNEALLFVKTEMERIVQHSKHKNREILF